MTPIESISFGKFYHIYNRGVDKCNLFLVNDNYEYFLRLYDKYISPVADTFAWVLMKNHFHFLVRIKEEKDIGYIPIDEKLLNQNESKVKTPSAVKTPDGGLVPKKYNPSHQFSHLFNAYAQAYNKQYNRSGTLFIRPFKRKLIDNRYYLKQAILYIHNNPVHHGFCERPVEYPWSSYITCITSKPSKLKREDVIDLFVDYVQFKEMHETKIDFASFEKWLGI